jgi:cyanate permease
MGSGAADDPYMKERSREVRWFLIILLCLGLLTVCGVVYIWMSPKV